MKVKIKLWYQAQRIEIPYQATNLLSSETRLKFRTVRLTELSLEIVLKTLYSVVVTLPVGPSAIVATSNSFILKLALV